MSNFRKNISVSTFVDIDREQLSDDIVNSLRDSAAWDDGDNNHVAERFLLSTERLNEILQEAENGGLTPFTESELETLEALYKETSGFDYISIDIPNP